MSNVYYIETFKMHNKSIYIFYWTLDQILQGRTYVRYSKYTYKVDTSKNKVYNRSLQIQLRIKKVCNFSPSVSPFL